MQKNYFNDRGWRILKALDEVAVELGANQTQVSIAWLIAQPLVTAPIASATSIAQLDDLMKAAKLNLDDISLAKLNTASAA